VKAVTHVDSLLEPAVRVDTRLAEIAESYSVLLAVTPTNTREAYRGFVDGGCEGDPDFVYRPQKISPLDLRRRLYELPFDEVEDPDLMFLLDQKRKEIDRELTLIEELCSPSFRFASMLLFGVPDSSLTSLAQGILAGIGDDEADRNPIPPTPSSREQEEREVLDAHAFCALAGAEIESYRRHYPGFDAHCEVRDDVVGLVVSKNALLVGEDVRVQRERAEAALHHEVGTHLVTYFNGKAQPLSLLATGLPGYDELQEGLAVVAEYLAGGFTRTRARLLAGRVVAVQMMCEGADFADTFRALHKTYGFPRRLAFIMCMRVYRGGGLTKDASYLRGLQQLLDYLARGGSIANLLIGKMSLSHAPHVEALRDRGLVYGPVIEPRFLQHGSTRKRIELLRGGLSILDLIEKN
jgi:uncharacterized protein (TIGR02421 family)